MHTRAGTVWRSCFSDLFALLTRARVAAGLTVFVVPWCLMRFFMMAANWGQHNPDSKDAHSLTIL
jgi:hypothetical protein